MTGYGKAEKKLDNKRLVVEIKSLNSKQMDMSVRLSPQFRGQELTVRSLLGKQLERGKIDVAIYTEELTEQASSSAFTPVNRAAYLFHSAELKELCPELSDAERAMIVLKMPDVVKADEPQPVSDEEWQVVEQAIQEAVEHFIAFRTQEGAALEAMFTEKLDAISALLAEVEPYEQGRVAKIRQHLLQNLDKLAEDTRKQVDSNRLEQELIYYLEKLDITEEKVRLRNHIKYFRETMEGVESHGVPTSLRSGVSQKSKVESGIGKKLGFIAQEMGREINTLGSKSNQSEMQIIVVKMKDLLEQIKEQVLNVL